MFTFINVLVFDLVTLNAAIRTSCVCLILVTIIFKSLRKKEASPSDGMHTQPPDMSVASVDSPVSERLTVRGEATAANAAQLRDQFGTWLREQGVDMSQTNEILLAVNEALANCVDHAYAGHDSVGTMAVRADFQPSAGCLSLCVTDHGRWMQPGPHRSDSRRGRGVALMHAMADHCTINGRNDGTTVCLDYRCR